jgi:PHD/YefM family antitoxin component YafN of YafNO toxin-antitoxin module
MIHSPQLIIKEKFANIQRAQAGLTKLFEDARKTGSFYRVMKNDTPMGVLLSNEMWEDFLEDMEAMSSPRYLASIKKARKEKTYSSLEVKKMLGL